MVSFYVFRPYLSDISKQMSGIRIAVLSNASLLNVEAWKTEKLLLKAAELLSRELAHEQLLRVRTITRIAFQVFYLFHSSLVPIASYVETFAKIECVNAFLLCHDDHNVVSRLIIYKQFAVSVGDGTSCRILDAFEEGIGVGTYLKVFTQ